ncbi:MAG: hypothetical protein WBP59_15230 [Ilumatobacteraceae bacterium]
MTVSRRDARSSAATPVYVILLVSFQIFLITVAVEAWADDNEALAWSTAGVSVAIAAASVVLWRLLRA